MKPKKLPRPVPDAPRPSVVFVGIDWSKWPKARVRRKLYVAGLPFEEVSYLEALNYEPVDVLALPRESSADHQEAIEAWLQGMAEGSIPADPERRKTIELEARERGLLVHRTMRIDAHLKLDKATMDELLSFGESRFTLNRASKEKIVEARMASLAPPPLPRKN